ncbi:MAG: DUF4401 domain-containing protein [Gammaproteobacteria bacterium]|nr:DUF4401 domain-containing protein [Gammaproteobacteria bacterium]
MTDKAESLWKKLQLAGVLEGTVMPKPETGSPWYVRLILGVSGWIAALFLLGFVALGMEFILDSSTASITLGIGGLVAASAIFHRTLNDFYEQFGLALSFTGQALIMFGLVEWMGWEGSTPWWQIAALQLLVTAVMPNFMQRLVAGYLATMALSVALTLHGGPFIVLVLATVFVVLVWLNEFHLTGWRAPLRPMGYGVTLALVQLNGPYRIDQSLILFADHTDDFEMVLPLWAGNAATGLLLVALVGFLISRRGSGWPLQQRLTTLAATAVLALTSLEAPGIATGFTILLLGFASSNRVLNGLGIIVLLFYISAYYYNLQDTLLVKSGILAATGSVLLLARWIVLRWAFPQEMQSHE